MKKIAFLLLAVALVFSFSSASAAGNNNNTMDDVKYLKKGAHEVVIVPKDNVQDKVKYGKFVNNLAEKWLNKGKQEPSGDVQAMYTQYMSGYDSMTYNGSTLYAQFNSTIDYPLCCHADVSGHSRGAWLGSNPFNADKITLADSISFTGVNISVSVPPGAGFSVNGNTASWQGEVTNNWQIDHYYSNIHSTGYDIYVGQSSSATFKFGTSFYTPTASDGTFL